MTEAPLVSIVTPSFNQARFLEATLLSVLEQDYPNLEYLVVDGASSDGSVDIIRRYAHRLSWWVSENDSGQSEAINKGLMRARGKYVAWLNSDDVYLPGAVSSAVQSFETHPEAGLVYGNARSIDSDGKPFNLMRAHQYTLSDLLSFQIICQPAAFMRYSVLQAVNYLDPAYQLLMDNLLWMRMAQKAPIVYVPQTWAAARYHEQAKNRTRGAAYGREARFLIENIGRQPDFAATFSENKRRIMAGVNRFDAFYLTEANHPRAALRTYARSFFLRPQTALSDWRHILLAFLTLLGLKNARDLYDRMRLRRLKLER